jgi:putative toxin-antitoxin system antitoxin component (TIGR02293 family)
VYLIKLKSAVDSPLSISFEQVLHFKLELAFLLLQETEAQIKLSQPAPPIPSPSLDLVTVSHQILGSSESVNTAKRLYRITTAYKHAADVFEDSDIPWDWLQSPNGVLGWKIPLDLRETDEGAKQVETILGRIDYGVYS